MLFLEAERDGRKALVNVRQAVRFEERTVGDEGAAVFAIDTLGGEFRLVHQSTLIGLVYALQDVARVETR